MMANILGLFHMIKEHQCTMDTAVENCINDHTPSGITKCKATLEGLYCWEPTEAYQEEISWLKKVGISNLVSTVQENRMGLTAQQVEEAKRARRLLHILGFPTAENFKNMLRMNAIKNCPVTVEDVTNADKLFGPYVASLKGRTTRSKVAIVMNDEIAAPPELKTQCSNITLYIDMWMIPFGIGRVYL
jgi:hypothetical protein